MAAIEKLDGELLRAELSRALVSLKPTHLMEDVIAPLMQLVGDRWSNDRLTPGQERLASASVGTTLREIISLMRSPGREPPELICATPTGQLHEIGALLAAATAAVEGWRVTALGADLPFADIADAARRRGARAVALSLVYPPDDPDLPAELVGLWRALPSHLPIIVGGAAAEDYEQTLSAIGAIRVASLGDLRHLLGQMHAGGSPAATPDRRNGGAVR
jgi:cobalamin-dependent methionine synthase I